jgi:hypothetical protein
MAKSSNNQFKAERERRLATAARDTMRPSTPPLKISARWLLSGLAITAAAALVCAWLAVCLLFWQGQWQLVFHPAKEVHLTPASVGIRFDAVRFHYTETGEAQLSGWWIPAESTANQRTFTLLYLHGATGNLGDTVEELAALHRLGVNLFAVDYRGYGGSAAEHPSEQHVYEDAQSAIDYLTTTRQIPAHSLVLYGSGLGAVIAAESALSNPQVAGIILDDPTPSARELLVSDGRWHVIPVRWLLRMRFDLAEISSRFSVPNLWLSDHSSAPAGYSVAAGNRILVSLRPPLIKDQNFSTCLMRFLDELK